MKKYASLHNHTEYSNLIGFLDSINKIDQVFDRAEELGFSALAITDHDVLSSHVQALQKSKDRNFKLILGNEIYLAKEGMSQKTYKKGDKFYHCILLAKNANGHRLLRELSYNAWNRSFYMGLNTRKFNFISELKEIASKYKGDVVVTTACLGGYCGEMFKTHMKEEAKELITEYLKDMDECFGEENVYIELQPSGSVGEQALYNRFLYENFKNRQFTVATDSHFIHKGELDLFKTILNSKSSKDREVEDFYANAHFMSWEDIEKLIQNTDDDFLEKARLNTLKIADQCEVYDLQKTPIIPKVPIEEDEILYELPQQWLKYETIKFFFESGYTQDRHLLYLIKNGFDKYIHKDYEKCLDRINTELTEIKGISERLNQRLSDYLVTMSRIIDIIWEEADSIIGPSRGSAGAFLTNYLIGITQWNPLDYPIEIPHWRLTAQNKSPV